MSQQISNSRSRIRRKLDPSTPDLPETKVWKVKLS